MIVLDASAVVEMLLRTPTGEAIENRIFAPNETLHAPHLIDVEVAHVIRRHAVRGLIDAAHGLILLTRLVDLPLRRYPHDPMLPRIWDLRHNFSAYDATYIALAEALDAPLLTYDHRLATAAGHSAKIEFCRVG